MKQETFSAQLEQLPRENPAHPYAVSLYWKDQFVRTIYVRSASPARARLSGRFWFSQIGPGQKISYAIPRPMMPIDQNQYWDYPNRSNPLGLKLVDWLKEHPDADHYMRST